MVYIVYKTDAWHSYASRDMLGVGTTKSNALKIVRQQVKKQGEKLSKDDLYNLDHINQTQNYNGEGEFVIEPLETNKLY